MRYRIRTLAASMLSRLILFFLLGLASLARATSVIPPTFDELIQQSELVFRGRVTAVQALERGDGAKRHISTRVIFAVEKTLRGTAGETIELEFLGGELGDRSLVVTGWPRFKVGDHGIFFVENRKGYLCPLARLRHGSYRLVTAGVPDDEYVMRDDLTPLRTLADIAVPLSERNGGSTGSIAAGLTRHAFEALVLARSEQLPQKNAP